MYVGRLRDGTNIPPNSERINIKTVSHVKGKVSACFTGALDIKSAIPFIYIL